MSVWRGHVPGEILTLRAFGNVVLVTTSERLVLALLRRRRPAVAASTWTRSPRPPPVRASEADVVLVDLAGEVRRLVIATGAVVWQHSLGADVTVAPAVGAGVVVVMDRGGHDGAGRGDRAADGGPWNWRARARGFVGDTLVLLQDQTAHGAGPGHRATGAGCARSSAPSRDAGGGR